MHNWTAIGHEQTHAQADVDRDRPMTMKPSGAAESE